MIEGPPARWIAPSTPPPPASPELAALTMTSAATRVMSPIVRRRILEPGKLRSMWCLHHCRWRRRFVRTPSIVEGHSYHYQGEQEHHHQPPQVRWVSEDGRQLPVLVIQPRGDQPHQRFARDVSRSNQDADIFHARTLGRVEAPPFGQRVGEPAKHAADENR